MEGIVFDIKRFAVHDGPGVRTTVFMKGCPLRCVWCHNPEGLEPCGTTIRKDVRIGEKVFTEYEPVGRKMTTGELLAELLKERVFMSESGGGVTFSGGEPLASPAFLEEMLRLCRDEGMHTAVDTSGYATWEVFEKIIPYTDLFLYDLKLADEQEHTEYTGVSNRLILENLRKLSACGAKIQVRIPVVPGITFTEWNIDRIVRLVLSLENPVAGISLLPYHNTGGHKYGQLGLEYRMAAIPSLDRDALMPLKEKIERVGISAKIGG